MLFSKQLLLFFLTAIGISLAIVSAISAPTSQSPTIPTIKQPQSIEPANAQMAKLDLEVAAIMERQHIPGMSVVVIKNGRVQALKGYGVADIETKQPVTPDTKFAIGSVTKQFTAMAVMMLVEEGKVNLDKPISQYLPDLPSQWQSLTLRQLLNHTAGISEEGYIRGRRQLQEFFKLVKPELDFPAGESFSYSNSGYFLAGLIIERMSGKTYSDFMRERIFTPLGMQQTQAKLTALPTLASAYTWEGRHIKGDLPAKSIFDSAANTELTVYSAGNIISTANDMTKWVQALDRGKLLRASSYQQLWTSGSLKNGHQTGYGLGWFVGKTNGHPYTLHSGAIVGGHATAVVRYPQDRLAVIVLSNTLIPDVTPTANSIVRMYEPKISLFGASPKPDPNPAFTKQFLALLQGNDRILPFASEYKLLLKTERGRDIPKYMEQFRKIQTLEFLLVENKYGNDRTYCYKAKLAGKQVIAFIVLTPQQEVQSYGVASLP
jgi:D-alanyl-D-alanine carboxypeptidase